MLYRNNSVNKSYLFLKSNVTRKTNNLPFFLLLCSPMYEKEAALWVYYWIWWKFFPISLTSVFRLLQLWKYHCFSSRGVKHMGSVLKEQESISSCTTPAGECSEHTDPHSPISWEDLNLFLFPHKTRSFINFHIRTSSYLSPLQLCSPLCPRRLYLFRLSPSAHCQWPPHTCRLGALRSSDRPARSLPAPGAPHGGNRLPALCPGRPLRSNPSRGTRLRAALRRRRRAVAAARRRLLPGLFRSERGGMWRPGAAAALRAARWAAAAAARRRSGGPGDGPRAGAAAAVRGRAVSASGRERSAPRAGGGEPAAPGRVGCCRSRGGEGAASGWALPQPLRSPPRGAGRGLAGPAPPLGRGCRQPPTAPSAAASGVRTAVKAAASWPDAAGRRGAVPFDPGSVENAEVSVCIWSASGVAAARRGSVLRAGENRTEQSNSVLEEEEIVLFPGSPLCDFDCNRWECPSLPGQWRIPSVLFCSAM